MSNLENMFADKEATRKKNAALEKAVSKQTNIYPIIQII